MVDVSADIKAVGAAGRSANGWINADMVMAMVMVLWLLCDIEAVKDGQ